MNMAELRRRKPDNEVGEQINEAEHIGPDQGIDGIHKKLHLKIADAEQVTIRINSLYCTKYCVNSLIAGAGFRRRTLAR